MKNLIKYGFIAVVICLSSCGKNPQVTAKIKMQKINGEWITKTYKLPRGFYLWISTNDYGGGYELKYRAPKDVWYNQAEYGRIRSGIIDYEICK